MSSTLIVTAENKLNLAPQNEREEIYQNVATILKTIQGSVPLDRDFGVDGSYIDLPMPMAKGQWQAEIIDAIERDEPRVRVLSVDFKENSIDAMDGILSPIVTVEIITND